MYGTNVYNGYLTGIERDMAIEEAQMENTFSRINTMWEMVNLEYEQNIRDAELKVFKESGTYDDLQFLYEEADAEAGEKKKGLLSKLLEFIGNIFNTIGGWFDKLAGANPPPDGPQKEKVITTVNGFTKVKDTVTNVLTAIKNVFTLGFDKLFGGTSNILVTLGIGGFVYTIIQAIGLDKIFNKAECDKMESANGDSGSVKDRFVSWFKNDNKEFTRSGDDMVKLAGSARDTYNSIVAVWKSTDEEVQKHVNEENNGNAAKTDNNTTDNNDGKSTNESVNNIDDNNGIFTEAIQVSQGGANQSNNEPQNTSTTNGQQQQPAAKNNEQQNTSTTNGQQQQPAAKNGENNTNDEKKGKNKMLETAKLLLKLVKDVFLAPFRFIVGEIMKIFKLGGEVSDLDDENGDTNGDGSDNGENSEASGTTTEKTDDEIVQLLSGDGYTKTTIAEMDRICRDANSNKNEERKTTITQKISEPARIIDLADAIKNASDPNLEVNVENDGGKGKQGKRTTLNALLNNNKVSFNCLKELVEGASSNQIKDACKNPPDAGFITIKIPIGNNDDTLDKYFESDNDYEKFDLNDLYTESNLADDINDLASLFEAL